MRDPQILFGLPCNSDRVTCSDLLPERFLDTLDLYRPDVALIVAITACDWPADGFGGSARGRRREGTLT